jgi:sialate O-acetylesterase
VLALFVLAATLISLHANAEVRLPHVLSDHAVLQRERPVRIWGWAGASEKIKVQIHEQVITAYADSLGMWEAWPKPEPAGGPYSLTVVGDASAIPVKRTDILIGDVWIASGQSNMEFSLTGFGNAPMKDSEKEIGAANQPTIRLLR